MNLQFQIKRLAIIFIVLQGIGLFVLLRRSNFLEEFLPVSNFANDEKSIEVKRFKENYFNVVKSEKIPLDRALADVRPSFCRMSYDNIDHLDTSIIIVFHNEAESTFYRTLTSICNRTPLNFIREIILVNDKSENREYLSRKAITSFASKLPVDVKLVEPSERLGLIRARMVGVSQASGQTLTFLDSHVEVTDGWIEPLLHEISENNTTVVCPIIDVINAHTFEYETTVDNCWGGFDFGLVFQWYTMRRRNIQETEDKILTPIIAGGLFMIDTKFFKYLGGYDVGMNVWGFENIEMSLRTWMCGGRLAISKCSHVGHVFREHSPYTFPQGVTETINANMKRTVDVWLDQYKELVYTTTLNKARVAHSTNNISNRILLRQHLKCKPFRWYLENIYPESMFPVKCKFFGLILSDKRKQCLCSDNMHLRDVSALTFCDCKKEGKQLVQLTKELFLRIGYHCLKIIEDHLEFRYCYEDDKFDDQLWVYQSEFKYLVNHKTNRCLSADLLIVDCEQDISIQWTLEKFSSVEY